MGEMCGRAHATLSYAVALRFFEGLVVYIEALLIGFNSKEKIIVFKVR